VGGKESFRGEAYEGGLGGKKDAKGMAEGGEKTKREGFRPLFIPDLGLELSTNEMDYCHYHRSRNKRLGICHYQPCHQQAH